MNRKLDDGPCEVYGIRDGEHGAFHYVGMSHTASGRWEGHLRPTYETRGGNVVRELGDRAHLVVLSRCSTRAKARERERKWSHRLTRWGHPLVNIEATHKRPDLIAAKATVELALPVDVWRDFRLEAIRLDVRPGVLLDQIFRSIFDDSSGVRAAIERWKAKHE